MRKKILTVTEHGHVDLAYQDQGVLESAVRNRNTLAALQDGAPTNRIEIIHVTRKTTRLALKLCRRGDSVDLGLFDDPDYGLSSLGGLCSLNSGHACLSVCRELDLVHFYGSGVVSGLCVWVEVW